MNRVIGCNVNVAQVNLINWSTYS